MDTSDRGLGKKLVEEGDLIRFLEAYRVVTGEQLILSRKSERPDFICIRPSDEIVGIELTQSPHNYDVTVWNHTRGSNTKSTYDLLESINGIVAEKEYKRRGPDWELRENTILVVKLIVYTFESYQWTNNTSLAVDFSDTGFVEIWLADCSTLEPFRQVRLIGLHPRRFWGTHHQPALEGKPFG
jgi:hypothetical protein